MVTHLWLRDETKKGEKRSPLSPNGCLYLLSKNFQISVEKSSQRIFNDEEYERVGCKLVESLSWIQHAPENAIILGLKELPDNLESKSLRHVHIFFAHCFKGQKGWKELLNAFQDGGGEILDLEFLQNSEKKRVAAFGFYAGFAGAALGLKIWHNQQMNGEKLENIQNYQHESECLNDLSSKMKQIDTFPKILIMGALGRCGSGACEILKKLSFPAENIYKWDLAETQKPGPYQQIADVDIFINCIYLSQSIPPFLTKEMLDRKRSLSVIVDVSCDPTNPYNPIPIYQSCTTFDSPTIDVKTSYDKPLEVLAIDHLPTLLPREASEAFCKDLLPCLEMLPERHTAQVWKDASDLYHRKCKESLN